MGMNYFFAASAAWESDPPVLVYADGGPVCKTPVNVRLIPRVLRVLSAE